LVKGYALAPQRRRGRREEELVKGYALVLRLEEPKSRVSAHPARGTIEAPPIPHLTRRSRLKLEKLPTCNFFLDKLWGGV